MNYSPADILRQYLVSLGDGTVSMPTAAAPWPAFVSALPEKVDEAVCLYDTMGRMDGRLMSGRTITHPGIQLRFRSLRERDGYDKARTIADVLDSIAKSAVTMDDGTSYEIQSVTQTTPILHNGEEPERRRQIHTFNVTITFSSL